MMKTSSLILRKFILTDKKENYIINEAFNSFLILSPAITYRHKTRRQALQRNINDPKLLTGCRNILALMTEKERTFFVNYIAPNEIEGTFLWANAISITAIIVAFLSPLLGAFADETGYRKFFLIFFTLLCSLFTALLYFPEKGDLSLAIAFVIISNIAFEMGCVFCNSYLKELSNDKNIGRVSGNAWGLGFLGGLSALFISFALFDVNNPQEVKQICVFVAIWFVLFSLPTFIFLKDSKRTKVTKKDISSSFTSIYTTFKEIRNHKKLDEDLL